MIKQPQQGGEIKKKSEQLNALNQHCKSIESIIFSIAAEYNGDSSEKDKEQFNRIGKHIEKLSKSLTKEEFSFFKKKISLYAFENKSIYRIITSIKPASCSEKEQKEFRERIKTSAQKFSDSDEEFEKILKLIKIYSKLNDNPRASRESQEIFEVISEDTPLYCRTSVKAENLILKTISQREERKKPEISR